METRRFDLFDNEDWREVIDLFDANGARIDLTGAGLLMRVRDRRGRFVKTLINETGLSIDGSVAGRLALEVPVSGREKMVPGLYRADLVMDRSGQKSTIMRGLVHVQRGVTAPLQDGSDSNSSTASGNIILSGGTF